MNEMTIAVFLAFGLIAGILSGLLGIGGGIFIIPALVFMMGFSQKMAQGTTLAMMIPPIGLLAAYAYYRAGAVDLKVAALMCAGFFIGGFIGAKFATALSGVTLSRIFGIAMLLISFKFIFAK
jgi:uncharacterized membrane protein YfcA